MMRLLLFAVAICSLLIVARAAYAGDSLPKVGQPAPLVSGTDQDGKAWNLADLIGKKVVLLYFYPKDMTSGCTKEACGLRDRIGELNQKNVSVIGVSCDSVESHQKFIAAEKLNFPLIADTDATIATTYGVKLPVVKVARRVSFLIGLDGKIIHITDAGSADTHLTEMSEAIAKLK